MCVYVVGICTMYVLSVRSSRAPLFVEVFPWLIGRGAELGETYAGDRAIVTLTVTVMMRVFALALE